MLKQAGYMIAIGVLMMIGTWLGKQVLVRTTPKVFLLVVDGLLIVLGVYFLVGR